MLTVLDGVVAELQDCALPLLNGMYTWTVSELTQCGKSRFVIGEQ